MRILWLIAAIASCAIGFAMLRHASPAVDRTVFSATLTALGLATLLAMHHRGKERAFWTGVALLGGLYLMASNSPEMEPRLITSRLVVELARHTHFEIETIGSITIRVDRLGDAITPPPNTLEGFMLERMGGPNPKFADRWFGTFPADTVSIQRVGHSLFAWIAGGIGGLFARTWWASSRRKRSWDRLGRSGTRAS